VAWFFALSGYLIAKPFLQALLAGNPLPSLREYTLRRIVRIVPAFWIAFTAFLLLVKPLDATVGGAASHYLFIQNEVPGQTDAIFAPAWTLGIEAIFYVVLPLVCYGVARFRQRYSHGALITAFVAAGVASFLWQSQVQRTSEFAESPFGTFFLFAPGLVVCVVEDAIRTGKWKLPMNWADRNLSAFAVAVLAIWLVVIGNWSLNSVMSQLVVICSGTLLLVAAVASKPWRSMPARVLTYVGVVSYGIYLWHWIVLSLLISHLHNISVVNNGLSWAVASAVVLALSLAVASVSWKAVEEPLIHWARGSKSRPRPQSPNGGQSAE